MDFRQLEAFCMIVETGSFSEAAKQMFLTQPTVSSHIHALEKELDANLLNRTTKMIELTEDGRQFYEYAKSMMTLREKTLRAFNRRAENRIRLGASSIPSARLLPQVLAAYYKQNQELTFEVVQSDSGRILEQIKNGELDMGVVGSPIQEEKYHCEAICKDEMVLVIPAMEPYITIKETQGLLGLLKMPYLMREEGSGTRKEANRFLETLGLGATNLQIVARMNDLESIRQAIVNGLGVSIISKKAAEDLAKDGKVILVSLDGNGVYRSYYLVYRESRILNRQTMDFIRFVEAYFSEKNTASI